MGYLTAPQLRLGAKIGDLHAKDSHSFRKRLIHVRKGRLTEVRRVSFTALLTSGATSAVLVMPKAYMMAGCPPVMWPMADSAAATLEGTNLTTRKPHDDVKWEKRNIICHV